MPVLRTNGISLAYDEYGAGEPVVMVTGTGAPGRVWRAHQVPALTAAGYRVITFDNRGIAPDGHAGRYFTLDDMAADLAGLIAHVSPEPCRVVGFSLGSVIVQELLVARPELVRQAVLMATIGRADTLIRAMAAAELDLCDGGTVLPPRYAAYVQALQYLSGETLGDEERLRGWLDVFEMSAAADFAGLRGQLRLQVIPDRRPAYRSIRCPCLVIAFEDDRIVRPRLVREVAECIPGSTYTELAGCGHYGYLEKPEPVNSAIIEFFAGRKPNRAGEN
ncbi:alpha/beta fold hydrolase [Streptomyces sp. NPDC018019]|uniref:alpha/beta fold hydrolase n=1 Tax=Streptomyces sp. NPDC018019 TaxID=3365030 RepID=UPI00379BD56B